MLERMWRNGDPLALLVGMQTGTATLENSVEVPQKVKNRSISSQDIGYLPPKQKSLMQRDTYTSVFIVALFTIAKSWKQPKCPSTDERIKKLWFIYTMEYYLAMRKNEIWPFAAMWIELESLMLSEISQAEKDRYHMFSLICGS